MSDAIRIALIAEGVTDFVFLHATVAAMVDGRPFDMKLLQPEGSVAFTSQGGAGVLGGGWKSVYKWCLQTAERTGGTLEADVLFLNYDVLIIHIDADVAKEDPARDHIDPLPELDQVLPCEQPCPPPTASTDPLRQRILSWLGVFNVSRQAVLCTPSKSTEAWVMAIFFPQDRDMVRRGFECFPTPATKLSQQPMAVRFAKSQAAYEARYAQIRDAWHSISNRLSEAGRFRDDFLAAVPPIEAAEV